VFARPQVLGRMGSVVRPELPVIAAVALAVVASLLVAHHVTYALALVFAVCFLLALAADIHVLPVFLVLTMFVESLALGPGLRVGRLVGGIALVVIAWRLATGGSARLRPNALLVTVAAFGVWTLASGLWASSASAVYANVLSYILGAGYMLTFALLVRNERQLAAVLSTFAFSALIFGLVAFVTYASSRGAVAATENARGSGLQGDPNYFATYQVIALPAALALTTWDRRPRWRAAYFAIVAVLVISVVSSLSREGLLALAGVVLATLLLPRRTFFRHAAHKTYYLAAIGVAAAAAALVGSASFVARAQSIINPTDRGSGRLDLWSAAWHGFHNHPWLGLGSGNFPVHALDLLQTTPGVNTTAPYTIANQVHNAYLETLVELGPIGAAVFIFMIGLCAWYLIRASRRARRQGRPALERFAVAITISLLGFAIAAIFLSIEFDKAIFILVGLALSLDVMTSEQQAAPS
jgi:putative inorganic carbon (hco3(-)) transporter